MLPATSLQRAGYFWLVTFFSWCCSELLVAISHAPPCTAAGIVSAWRKSSLHLHWIVCSARVERSCFCYLSSLWRPSPAVSVRSRGCHLTCRGSGRRLFYRLPHSSFSRCALLSPRE